MPRNKGGRPPGTVPSNKNPDAYRFGKRVALRPQIHAIAAAAAKAEGVGISFWVERAILASTSIEVAEKLGLVE